LSNVIKLQPGGTRPRVPTGVDSREIAGRSIELQKSELQRAFSLMDIVISNVRKVANQIADPRLNKIMNDRLTAIEDTLRLAREKAGGL
jgi:hypothetical protein